MPMPPGLKDQPVLVVGFHKIYGKVISLLPALVKVLPILLQELDQLLFRFQKQREPLVEHLQLMLRVTSGQLLLVVNGFQRVLTMLMH